MEGGIYKAASEKSGGTNFDELRDTISTLNEGTNFLVTLKRIGWFIISRCKTSAIKFAMAGSQDWSCRFPPVGTYIDSI